MTMNSDFLNIYGTEVNFTIFNKKKFTNLLGLVCSIMTVVLIIVFGFIFGEDFIYKQNPRTTVSKYKPSKETFFNLTQDIFYFPWRIEDLSGKPVDFKKLVHLLPTYEKISKDPTTEMKKKTSVPLNYTKCKPNEEYLLKANINVEEYYCLNFDTLSIGGTQNADNYDFITIEIATCPDGASQCDYADILGLINLLKGDNPWYFSFIYPEHNFEPNAHDEPLRILYKKHNFKLDYFTKKVYEYVFQMVNMNDDQGILLPTTKSYSFFAFYEKLMDFWTLSDQQSSIFFKLNLSMSKDNDVYSRRYIQLPEVVANIGGVFNVMFIIFKVLCQTINDPFYHSSLLAHFFLLTDRDKNPLKEQSTMSNAKNNESFDNLAPEKQVSIPQKKEHKENKHSKINKIPSLIHRTKSSQVNQSLSIRYIIMTLLFMACVKKRTRETVKCQALLRALHGIKKRLEITQYIKMTNENQVMKHEFLSQSYQSKMNFLMKVNPFNRDEVDYFYSDLMVKKDKIKERKRVESTKSVLNKMLNNFMNGNNFTNNQDSLVNNKQ